MLRKINRLVKTVVLIGAAFYIMPSYAQSNQPTGAIASVKPAQEQQNVVYTSPIGYWKQIDDRTQQLQSILHIYDKDGRLYGKVLKTYTVNGVPPDVRCTKCKDELYNKEIIGLVVLSGFQQKTDVKWSGGQILDPKSGKIYQSNLTLTNNGNTLIVRGYVGISMLGRSQTWYRTTKPK